jgi:hypothetical protein
MPLRSHALPAGFIAPCLPTSAAQPPSGAMWLPEIKHDGFRVIARKNAERVKLYSRPGNDLTYRFPLIVEALARLRSRSCIIDGEPDRVRHRWDCVLRVDPALGHRRSVKRLATPPRVGAALSPLPPLMTQGAVQPPKPLATQRVGSGRRD